MKDFSVYDCSMLLCWKGVGTLLLSMAVHRKQWLSNIRLVVFKYQVRPRTKATSLHSDIYQLPVAHWCIVWPNCNVTASMHCTTAVDRCVVRFKHNTMYL